MPHVSLTKVIQNLLAFVHRVMVITQLTHLHLTIPSSGSTTEPVPLECFLIVPLRRRSDGPPRVSFAVHLEVIRSPLNLSSLGEQLDPPDQSLQEDTLHHDRVAVMIAPPTYVLFPSVDPFEEEELLSPPRFPFLLAPPGFAPLSHPGDLPGPTGMAYRDWSPFFRPTFSETGVDNAPVPSPIAHVHSLDLSVTSMGGQTGQNLEMIP